MSIIYRPHRGGLAESMKEAKEFNDEKEMKEHIVQQWNGYFTVDDIVIEDKVSKDERVGWEDTRYVCTKRFRDTDNIKKYGTPQCIGMCATIYKK